MKLRALVAALGLVLAQAASATYFGFAGGAFVYQSQTGTAIPNVIGITAAAADTALVAAGFVSGTVAARCSAATSGLVVVQNPAAGTLAAAGAAVDLLTSNGTPCKQSGGSLRMRGTRTRGL